MEEGSLNGNKCFSKNKQGVQAKRLLSSCPSSNVEKLGKDQAKSFSGGDMMVLLFSLSLLTAAEGDSRKGSVNVC